MYHALTNVQSGDSLHLPQYIDNRDGLLRVGLRSITYTVGWYNVYNGEAIITIDGQRGPTAVRVDPGLYGFDSLKALIEGTTPHVTLDLNKSNGHVVITIDGNQDQLVTPGLGKLLGFDKRRRLRPGKISLTHLPT